MRVDVAWPPVAAAVGRDARERRDGDTAPGRLCPILVGDSPPGRGGFIAVEGEGSGGRKGWSSPVAPPARWLPEDDPPCSSDGTPVADAAVVAVAHRDLHDGDILYPSAVPLLGLMLTADFLGLMRRARKP